MGSYKNVMEILIEEEMKRQIAALPHRVVAYLNPVELVAYALNQLPPLYATTEKGLNYQLRKGRSEHGVAIAKSVRRAIAAVQRDPIRTCSPLPSQQHNLNLQGVLRRLKLLLKDDQLDWEAVPSAVEHALLKANHAHENWNQPWTHPASTLRHATSARQVPPYSASRGELKQSPQAQPSHRNTSSVRRVSQSGFPAPYATDPEPEQRPHISSDGGWDDPFHKL